MDQGKNIWSKLKDKIFKKKKENSTTALGRMTGIMNFVNTFAYTTGLEFTDDWKINRRTVFAAIFMVILSFLLLDTFYITFPSTQSIVLIGGCAFHITVATKMTFIALNHDKYMSVVRFIYKVFKCNPSGRRQRILLNVMDKIHYHFKVNISGFLVGVTVYSAFPYYDFIVNGNLTLSSPLLIPYIDPKIVRGYLITSAINVFIAIFCVTVCVAISSLFFALVDTYDGMVSLIEMDFEAFDGMCKRNERGLMYERQFRNILMGLTDLARFSAYTNDLYGVIATVQLSSSYIVVVTLLAAFFVSNYICGIGGAMSFYTEMVMYCYMGQLLDNTNKRIVTVISNAKWYMYEVKYQKDIVTAIYIAQNQQSIFLANVFPLNFDTGLRVLETIYFIIVSWELTYYYLAYYKSPEENQKNFFESSIDPKF